MHHSVVKCELKAWRYATFVYLRIFRQNQHINGQNSANQRKNLAQKF